MVIVVMFGLMITNILTMDVVPTLYALIKNTKENFSRTYERTHTFFLSPVESEKSI